MLNLLIKLFGKGYVNRMIGTATNVSKPIKLDKNSPFKLYSDKAFNDPKVLDFIEEKIMEYGPYALSNKNATEVKNFEMNARRLLNARQSKEGSTLQSAVESMFGPLGKKIKPEAEIVDITTQKPVSEKGILTLKKELGLPEGVEPGSIADKAIKESVEYKTKQQGVKSVLDEDYVPPKTTLIDEDEVVSATKMSEQGAKAYSANIESFRRPIVRQMLLKDTRIKLPADVRESLLMKSDLQRGADPKMDPLRLVNEYYDVDFKKLDELEEIRFTAKDEFEAADEFLQKGGLKPKDSNLGDRLKDLDDDIPDMAEGGRIGFAGGGIKFLLNLINKKFGKDTIKTADQVKLTDEMKSQRNERRLLEELQDYKEIAPKFYQRMNLKLKYPGISDELIAKIMADDDPQRIAEVMATMDEGLKMVEKGMSNDEIISIFKKTPRTKNAGGGLNYLMGM
tara:strand:+ start:195 stop:1550 length:1356 start_codon:yes stop_codon:yes gene_type:complete